MALTLRPVESTADLTHVRGLLADYEAEVAVRLLADYGMVLGDIAPDHLTELESLLVAPGFLLVAEVDGIAAGLCGIKDLGRGVGELKRMYVDPAFRGQGVARALVEQLLVEAEGAGFRRLRLESGVWMAEAHKLYRSVGFVDTTDYAGREFQGVPESNNLAVFMERTICDV